MYKEETYTGWRDAPSPRDPYANDRDERGENAVDPDKAPEEQAAPENMAAPENLAAPDSPVECDATPAEDEGGDEAPSISDTRELFIRLARPADRRAKEFLPQWLRRQGRI